MSQDTRTSHGAAKPPQCPNCGSTGRHTATCLLARQADRLRAADLARVATTGGYSRPLHHTEAAALDASRRAPLTRRERRAARVRVDACGRGAVIKTIHLGDRPVAVLVDADRAAVAR